MGEAFLQGPAPAGKAVLSASVHSSLEIRRPGCAAGGQGIAAEISEPIEAGTRNNSITFDPETPTDAPIAWPLVP